jgi:hypothetical protein
MDAGCVRWGLEPSMKEAAGQSSAGTIPAGRLDKVRFLRAARTKPATAPVRIHADTPRPHAGSARTGSWGAAPGRAPCPGGAASPGVPDTAGPATQAVNGPRRLAHQPRSDGRPTPRRSDPYTPSSANKHRTLGGTGGRGRPRHAPGRRPERPAGRDASTTAAVGRSPHTAAPGPVHAEHRHTNTWVVQETDVDHGMAGAERRRTATLRPPPTAGRSPHTAAPRPVHAEQRQTSTGPLGGAGNRGRPRHARASGQSDPQAATPQLPPPSDGRPTPRRPEPYLPSNLGTTAMHALSSARLARSPACRAATSAASRTCSGSAVFRASNARPCHSWIDLPPKRGRRSLWIFVALPATRRTAASRTVSFTVSPNSE